MNNNTAHVDAPEHELLLCCARTQSDKKVSEQLQTLAATSIDWDYLFKLARRHSVLPLVYRQLQTHASHLVPDDQLNRFRVNYQENVARNLVLISELTAITRAFADEGIESVPFKGPALAVMAYGDLSLRRFVDLDVIVKKEDVFRARNVLSKAGYTASLPLDEHQQSVLLRTQHCVQFRRDNGRMIFELHWNVASDLFASPVSAPEFWQRLIQFEVNGERVKSFSADDLLFALCVHGSRHIWERLSWICDIAELIQREQLNWAALIDRATTTDSERMFYLGLFLAERLLGTRLPPEVKSRIEADHYLQVLTDGISARLFSGTEHIPATSGQVFRFNFNLRKSWRGRARYFAFTLKPNDVDLSGVWLPRPLYFAYYLMRPMRLFVFDKR
ncbi:MAG TPA: nucleotidyltransferase family protein [Pyrinomonadaceae bacterium]